MSDSEPTVDSESESDELHRIREQKRQELLEGQLGDDPNEGSGPDEPVYLDGRGQFDRFVSEHQVVLVDFYADWCGPCQMLNPIVEAVARKTDAAVLKVDVDQYVALAREYGVQGVPTIVLFADGQPVQRFSGVQDEGTLTDLVEQYAS